MKNSTFANLSLLFVAFIWGVTFVVVQQALAFLQPFSFNGIRFFIAACLLWVVLLIFKKDELKHFNKKLLFAGMFLGIWLFVGYAAQTIGLLYTSAAKAGFITGLSVVIVPLLAFLLLKDRPRRNAIIGVVIATTGLYLLTMTNATNINIGDILVLICAIGFALHIVFTGKYSYAYPTLLLTAIQISTVACLATISAILFENSNEMINFKLIFSPAVISSLLITACLATALAFFIQTNFQKYTSPTRVALIFATEPVFAALAGYLWAGDRLSTSSLIGCVLILTGMIIAEWQPRKNRQIKNIS